MSPLRTQAGSRGARAVIYVTFAAILLAAGIATFAAWNTPRNDPHAAALITAVSGDVTALSDKAAADYAPSPCNHDSTPTGPDTGQATQAWTLPGGVTVAITARSFPDEQTAYENSRELAASVAACVAYEQDGVMQAIRDASGTGQATISWEAKQAHDEPEGDHAAEHDHDDGVLVMTWTTTPGDGSGTVWASATDGTTVYIAGVSGTNHLPDPGTASTILISQLGPDASP